MRTLRRVDRGHSHVKLGETRTSLRSVWAKAGLNLLRPLLLVLFVAVSVGNAAAAETRIKTLALARVPEATTIEIRLPVEEGSDDLGLAELSRSDKDWYRLRVSVARARKPPLWTGYIERTARGADRRAIYTDMAGTLFEFWGATYSGPE